MWFLQRVKKCENRPYLFCANRAKELVFFSLFLLFLVTPLVSAEIINEKTEKNGFSYKFYSAKKFDYYNGEFRTFDYMINNANVDDEKTIIYNFRNGYYIKFHPFVWYNGEKKYVKDLPVNIRNQINYGAVINKFRDNIKFDMELNKIPNLQAIGLKLETNVPVSENRYNYTKSGVYNDVEPEVYEMVDVIFNDKFRLSFTDVIEAGYNASFDVPNKEVTIDLRDRSGFLTIDPTSTYYSESNDGYLNWEEPATCLSATSSGTTAHIDDNHQTSPAEFQEAFVSFNTSLIPDDATISSANLKLYAHSYTSKNVGSPSWVVTYDALKDGYGTLACPGKTFSLLDGTLDWAGTTGTKTKSIVTSHINITGFTSFRQRPNWWHLAAGQQQEAQFRTSEYSGSSSDPQLVIVYTTPSGLPPPGIIWDDPTPRDKAILNSCQVYLNTTIEDVDNDLTSAFYDFDNDLKAYYSMEARNSSGVFDNSTFKNFGEFKGSVTEGAGVFGNASYVTGTGYIDTNVQVMPELSTQPFTISAWVNHTTGNTQVAMAQADSSNSAQFQLLRWHFFGGQYVLLTHLADSDNNYIQTRYNYPNDDVWSHVVFTYNGSKTLGGMNMYFDGVKEVVDYTYSSGTLNDNWGNTGNFTLGTQYSDAPTKNYTGGIDEVKVWHRVLSDDEIKADYDSRANRLFNNFTGLDNPGNHNYSAYAIDAAGNINVSGRTFRCEIEQDYWDVAIILSLFGSAFLWIFLATKFDKKEHWPYRMFLLICSAFLILIAINVTLQIDDLQGKHSSSVETIVGTLDAGDVDSLEEVDGDAYNVSEAAGNPGYDIRSNFTNVAGFSMIEAFIYYNGNLGHDVDMLIYNYDTSSWDFVGDIIDSTSYIDYQFHLNDTNHISDGLVQLRLLHDVGGNPIHDIFIDHWDIKDLSFDNLETAYWSWNMVLYTALAMIFILFLIWALKKLNQK